MTTKEKELEKEPTKQMIIENVHVLEESLKDDKIKEQLIKIIDSYIHLNRSELIYKTSIMLRQLANVIGEKQSSIMMNYISREYNDIKMLFDDVSDQNVKKWLIDLNGKYITYFEGIYPPIPNDWYRAFWMTHLDISHGIPMLNLTILKRNGENVTLDMPFDSMIKLIKHQLSQIELFQKNTESDGRDDEMILNLKELKEIIDRIVLNVN